MNCAFGFEKRLIVFSLGLVGGHRSESLMRSIVIVKRNIFIRGILEFFFRFIKIAQESFFLDRSKKRLGDSVIVW